MLKVRKTQIPIEKRFPELAPEIVFAEPQKALDEKFERAHPPLAVVTCHFNFANHIRPVQNLRRFVRQIERDGIPVYGIEAVIKGGAPPAMANKSRWEVVELSQHGVLWQKEALLNKAALGLVPDSVPYIAAIDADVWFENPDWSKDTIETLSGGTKAMQPFSLCVWSSRDGEIELVRESATKGGLDHTWRGHPGFAWAFHRSFFEQVGFYPWAVLGSGDTATSAGLLDTDMVSTTKKGIGFRQFKNGVYDTWRGLAQEWMDGSRAGWIDGAIWHEWHGTRKNRKYADRAEIVANAYDACRDVSLTDEGWLEWTRYAHPKLMSQVANYFTERKEDG